MVLELEQLIAILRKVNPQSNSTETFKEIKKLLEKECPSIYQKWQENEFNINYLFEVKGSRGIVKIPLLYVVAACDKSVVVNHLVEEGADVDLQNNYGRTALHLAALHRYAAIDHLEIVKCLVEKGADLDLQDGNGFTALHYAAEGGHLWILKCLVEKGANVNLKDKKDRTALHYAASLNVIRRVHLEIVKCLVEKGADLDLQDGNGCTALHCAAERGHLEIVKCLVEKEAALVDLKDEYGMTALHCTAFNGHLKIVECLVENRANVNLKDEGGMTALHWAAFNGHLKIVECLVKNRANVNLKDEYGRTALDLAGVINHEAIIDTLLNAGAKSKYYNTPRDLANDENVKQLLEKAENKEVTNRENVSSIPNEADSKFYGSEGGIPHITKGNKLPIITASAGLLLGLSIAYLAGAATLTPVGAVVAVFLAAAVVGALIGYGFGKFCEKVSEKKQKDPDMSTWGAVKNVFSDVFTTGHSGSKLQA